MNLKYSAFCDFLKISRRIARVKIADPSRDLQTPDTVKDE